MIVIHRYKIDLAHPLLFSSSMGFLNTISHNNKYHFVNLMTDYVCYMQNSNHTTTIVSLTGMLITAVMTGILLCFLSTNTFILSDIPLSLLLSTYVSKA